MIKFLLGVVVGAAGMASYLKREMYTGARTTGHVDELSSAAYSIVADPQINAGDGTPDHTRDMAIA